MTGLYLTAEAVQARRLELATVEEQIRALGRRKSVLRAEILSGYAAPVKGAPVEQLPLVETATATAAAPVPQASRQELLRKAILDELGHGLATFGELLTTCMRDLAWTSQHMPQTTEVRDVLKALCEEGKVVWDEAKKVYHLPPPPAPKKAKAKKAPEAPRPTVTVGEAMAKMLAEVSVHDWQQARAEVCDKIAQRKGEPVSVGSLLLKVGCDSNLVTPVLELLDAAGAIVLGSRSGVRAPWGKAAPFATPSATVGDEEIAHDLQALTRRYVRGLVEDWGGDPTTADLAGNLELPAALIDSVLIELRAAQELLCDREGRWSVRSPRTSAAARTAPLFADVEPAPAGDGLEPEGDES